MGAPAKYKHWAGDADTVVYDGSCVLMGVMVEGGANATVVVVYDDDQIASPVAAKQLLPDINVAATSTRLDWLGPDGVRCDEGISVVTDANTGHTTIFWK